MSQNSRLSRAIALILGGCSSGLAIAEPAADAANMTSEAIQEITVTAQRRSENMEDVPITIQALTGETLSELNVTTFDELIKYLPNVSVSSIGPGGGTIFMRGLSVGVGTVQNSATIGFIPNTALYVDEQSASLPGRNLDFYAADLERIEVLEGPQGTLFGSGAEAGVLRYITNKPKLDVTEGAVNAGYSYTAHGDPNSNADATLNLPVIPGVLAVRAVIYDDHRGGYINNIPTSFVRSGTDEGLTKYNNGVVPSNSAVINNSAYVGNAINPLTYQGLRVSALARINDNWNVLLAEMYQNMDAQGVFYQMPYASNGTTFSDVGSPIGSQQLPHLSVNLFNPSYDKDKFENTALTVNGTVGDLKLVYSGGYLTRHVDQVQDYTNYARGVFGYYYQCVGLSPTSAASGKCYSPSATWRDTIKNTHQSHEIRLTTPDEWRIRAIGGLFYEQYITYDDTEWLYKTVPTCSATINTDCFNNIQPIAGIYPSTPGVRGDSTAYLSDIQKIINQKAAFGSADIDIIPKTLTLTLGTRYYRFNEKIQGSAVSSFGCKVDAPTAYYGPCLAPSVVDVSGQDPNHSTYSGFRSRANLSWKINPDALVYYTWSQGFRPGGFNVGLQGHLPVNGVDQYISPATFGPDSLTNNELGFKTLWFNRRLQLNGAIYQEDWKNTQVGLFDPQAGLGSLEISTNAGTYQVRGAELQVVARITDGLTVQGASSYNHSKQTNSPFLINNNPLSPTFGQPITTVLNPFGAVGSSLANSPELQWNVRLRDEIPFNDYTAFWQIGAQHISSSLSATGHVPAFLQPGYTTFDAAAGMSTRAWTVQVFGENLTSVNASMSTNSNEFVVAETVTRPRIAGIRLSYKF
jgi:iron complex outermembrane recepter protein